MVSSPVLYFVVWNVVAMHQTILTHQRFRVHVEAVDPHSFCIAAQRPKCLVAHAAVFTLGRVGEIGPGRILILAQIFHGVVGAVGLDESANELALEETYALEGYTAGSLPSYVEVFPKQTCWRVCLWWLSLIPSRPRVVPFKVLLSWIEKRYAVRIMIRVYLVGMLRIANICNVFLLLLLCCEHGVVVFGGELRPIDHDSCGHFRTISAVALAITIEPKTLRLVVPLSDVHPRVGPW